MKDPYVVLGISKDATDEEVKAAYRELARRYHPDNYGDDNPLKDLANEKMQEVNAAYDQILKMRSNGGGGNTGGNTGGSSFGIYFDIRQAVNSRRFRDAEQMLGGIAEPDRTAEWHYLASVLLMHRGRQNDAMRELEIACNMDPTNMEYQNAKTMFNNTTRTYGNNYYGGNGQPMRSSSDEACNCCANLICLDCCCECMGGDLIPCL